MIQDVTVGVMFPLTGPKATSGGQTVDAFPIAYQVAQEQGRANGLNLAFLYGDAFDEETGARECERLIDDGAQIIMGSLISSHALAFSEVAHRRGIFYWEVVAAAQQITDRGFPYLFRQSSCAEQYGSHYLEFLETRLLPAWGIGFGDLRLALIHEDTAFGASVADSVTEEGQKRGLQVVARESHPMPADNVDEQIARIAAAKPDLLFSASLGEYVPLTWNAIKAHDLRLKALVGTGSWGLPKYMCDRFGPEIDGIYCLDTPHLGTVSPAKLAPAVRKTFDRWFELAPMTHDKYTIVDPDLAFMAVTTLIEELLPRARSLAAEDLREAAFQIDVPIGGTIMGYGTKFRPDGNNERSFRSVVQWQDGGELRTVYPELLAVTTPRTEFLRP